MNKYVAIATALATSLVAMSSADATVTFNLAPVIFDSGGSFSGSVSLNDAQTMIEGYDFATIAGKETVFDIGIAPIDVSGTDYTPSNSVAVVPHSPTP